MIRVATKESVEVLEAFGQRPVLERSGRGPLVSWCEVPFPHSKCRITLCPEDLRERSRLVRDASGVPREVHWQVGQHADPYTVVIAACQQAGSRRRAHCSRVEVGQANTSFGESIYRWSGDIGAVAPELSESNVVQHNDDDVRRSTLERTLRRPRGRLRCSQLDRTVGRRFINF